jgi:hypothetical protein
MVHIWHLLEQAGVRWSRNERERRLFHVCVQVQARLIERYPDYTVPQVHVVPEALVDEVKEMLDEVLFAVGIRHSRAASAFIRL